MRQKAKKSELLLNTEICLNKKSMENNNSLIIENSELYQKLLEEKSNFDKVCYLIITLNSNIVINYIKLYFIYYIYKLQNK